MLLGKWVRISIVRKIRLLFQSKKLKYFISGKVPKDFDYEGLNIKETKRTQLQVRGLFCDTSKVTSKCNIQSSVIWGWCRGGWTRAELHPGSTLQYALVYTSSHAVRTSELATEDPLKLEFLSSFRCKCWTLNVILLQNCSDYLTNTGWSMKTIKTWVFLRWSPRVKTSPRVTDQSGSRRWIYAAISSIYPATF